MEPDSTLDEIAALSAELQALCGSLAGANAALQDESEGSDPSNAVTVILNRAGRVATVRPSSMWRDRITPEEFGTAVLNAVQAAQAVRLERWAEAARSAPPAAPAPQPQPQPGTAPAINLTSLLDEVMTAFDTVDRLAEQAAEQRATRTVRQTGDEAAPAGEAAPSDVRVTLSAQGEVAAVSVDGGWAARTNLSRLSERVLEAFEQAYEQYDSGAATRSTGIELPPQMQAVAADPAGTLLRYVEDLRASLS